MVALMSHFLFLWIATEARNRICFKPSMSPWQKNCQ